MDWEDRSLKGMYRIRTRLSLVLLLALPALNGCLWHTRRVPKAKLPTTILTATPQKLVDIINSRYDAIQSMSAAVTFTATSGGILNGKEKTITPFSGYILLRKPESLRVIGYLPVVHSPAFDMASNGNSFKLQIPPKSEAIEGPNALTQPSQNAIENLRPYMFFDSMVIPQIARDEVLSVTADSNNLVVNPKTRKLEIRPEYLLTVQVRQPGSRFTQVLRVIHISRIDLRPVQQDIYDENGQVQTQALYGPLQTFGTERFPGTVTIKWPQQQEQILITIEKLRVNLPLANDQFELKIPEGTKIKELH
jgi:outer membrane lipoprotein-sorting protein